MPKPACVRCQRFYRPKRNGVHVAEMMPDGNDVLPGLEEPERWRPYKVWHADLWRCEGCGHEIVVGYGARPVSEHYLPDFAYWQERTEVTVNDC